MAKKSHVSSKAAKSTNKTTVSSVAATITLANPTNNEVVGSVVTDENIRQLSTRVVYKDLTTVELKSAYADLRVGEVNGGSVEFLTELKRQVIGGSKLFQSLLDRLGKETIDVLYEDGYDLVEDCIAFLLPYRGHNLEEVVSTDSKGNPVTLLKATFRFVNSRLYANRQRVYKTLSIDGKFPVGELVVLPEWDTEVTFGDLPEIEDIIQSLGLNDRQRQVVAAKFATEGSKVADVANAVGISVPLYYKSRQQVATKLLLKRPETMLAVLRLTFRQKYVLKLRFKMLGKNATFDGIFDTDEEALRRMARYCRRSAIPDMRSISADEIAETLSLVREKAREFFPKH